MQQLDYSLIECIANPLALDDDDDDDDDDDGHHHHHNLFLLHGRNCVGGVD